MDTIRDTIPVKRITKEDKCIIHLTDDDTALTTPRDLTSWQNLHKGAVIQNYKPLLDAAKGIQEDEVPPNIFYHRRCRSNFMLKAASISKGKEEPSKESEMARDTTKRMASDKGTVYGKICIFCQKSKYKKGENTRERLVTCCELRVDKTLYDKAVEKRDSQMLGILSRELVAAEAHYHRSCYRDYIK